MFSKLTIAKAKGLLLGFWGSPITAVDWQVSALGKGASDISKLVMFSLNVDVRRSIEDSLVKLYHSTLVSEGVRGYSIDQCRADYRLGILNPFNTMVMALGNLDVSYERAQARVTRASASIRDHDLVGLLRAM